MKRSVFLILLFFAIGCRSKGPRFDPYQEGGAAFAPAPLTNRIDSSFLMPPTEPFRLGPGDTIQIEPIGESTGHTSVTLGPDGKVYYSLLPGLSLWGLSIPECRTTLQREMAKYNRATPDLVINLRGVASQRVWFLGAIQSPGLYPLVGPTTLLQAIATLGGLAAGNGKDDAVDYGRSFILRDGRYLPVDFERLIKYADASQNIYLQPDDFIFIRPTDLPSVYVLGAVSGPTTVPYSKELTVARLIVTLGGAVKFAQVNRIVIVRGSLSAPKVAELDYLSIVKGKVRDIVLEPGDIVYVPFSPYRRLAQLAEELLNQFVRTIAVNEGSYVAGGTAVGANVNLAAPALGGGGGISTP